MNKLSLLPAIFLGIAACTGSPALSQTSSTDQMTESPRLTIERLYASPSLSGPSPRSVAFSPDGARVTFLKARENDASRYDLWQFDVATGEQSLLVDSQILEPEEVQLSEEEIALRERRRIAGQRGIVSYDWGTANTILVPIGGDLHLITLNGDEAEARQLTNTEAFEYDAKVSPQGNFVSFIRDGAVFIIDLATGEEKQITPDADPDNAISYGVAEFVAQEEMSRYTGYWWSPDERYVAYTKVDESTVDVIERFDIAADKTTVIDQRYPRAGRPNAIVDLFVRDMETGEAVDVSWRRDEWGPATDQYLTRVNWGGSALIVQAVNREQTLIKASQHWPETGFEAEPFFTEDQKNWVNLNSDFVTLSSTPGTADTMGELTAMTTVEIPGYRTPAIIGPDGMTPVLDDHSGVVLGIEAYIPDRNELFLTAKFETPLETHLYRVNLPPSDEALESLGYRRMGDGSCYDTTPDAAQTTKVCPEPVRLTEAGKSWSVQMSPDGKSFVGTSSSPTQPPQTGLYRVPYFHTDEELEEKGWERLPDTNCIDTTPMAARIVRKICPETELIAWIEENRLDESHPYFPYLENHTTPEYGTLTAEDGQSLHYSIQTPPDFDPNKQYPVIIEVYGGPHVQTVTRNWERLSDVFYTHQGYIVFRLDNRGSYNRGKKFEDVIYRQTGGPEVRDQLRGVEWLKSQSFVDADRIAIQGWSYGGYMTLMTLLQAEPGTFAAAASGAPVTDWSLYDTFYTERYMDTPQDNADGYEKSSVFYHLDKWEGDLPPLLLMHGMADDNVTFDNMTRLMAELQQRGLMFDVMTYPGQRHGIRGEALQIHLMKTRMRFLDRHLKD